MVRTYRPADSGANGRPGQDQRTAATSSRRSSTAEGFSSDGGCRLPVLMSAACALIGYGRKVLTDLMVTPDTISSLKRTRARKLIAPLPSRESLSRLERNYQECKPLLFLHPVLIDFPPPGEAKQTKQARD